MMHLSIFSRVRGNISTAPGIQKRYLPITEIIARESPRYVQDAKNPVSHIPPKNVQRHSEGDQIWQDSYAVGLKMIGENELS